jgi:hypothetical protein
VDHALVLEVYGIDARFTQLVGVGTSFVLQRVESRRQNEGRRKVREVIRKERGRYELATIPTLAEIVLHEPVQELGRQPVALAKRLVRRHAGGEVGARIDEELIVQVRRTVALRQVADDRRLGQ